MSATEFETLSPEAKQAQMDLLEEATMSFTQDRMYKWEENHQRSIDDDVEEYVLEHYGVGEVSELTQEQINAIVAFADENEYSIMRGGFYNLMNRWEDENL